MEHQPTFAEEHQVAPQSHVFESTLGEAHTENVEEWYELPAEQTFNEMAVEPQSLNNDANPISFHMGPPPEIQSNQSELGMHSLGDPFLTEHPLSPL